MEMGTTYMPEAAPSQCLHTAFLLIPFPHEVPETQRLRDVPKIFTNWQVVVQVGCIPYLYRTTWRCNSTRLRKNHTFRLELTPDVSSREWHRVVTAGVWLSWYGAWLAHKKPWVLAGIFAH